MDAPLGADALTLDQLRLFLAVVDTGSFSAAARSLKRAQSAVSYGIANLERQLGVILFDRATRKPALTAAGRELAAEARNVTVQVDQLRARARGMAQGVEPRIAVAVDHIFPLRALVAALGDFRAEFPTVALTLHIEALGAVAELVAMRVCTIGIGAVVPNMPDGLERRPLARIEMVQVAAPGHPLAQRRGVIPSSVVQEEVQIVLADRSRLTENFQLGVFSGRTWRVLDLPAKHALLLAGLGWGGMPVHLVTDDLAKKRLVKLRIEGTEEGPLVAHLHAMHRTADPPGPAAGWLCERLGRMCAEREKQDEGQAEQREAGRRDHKKTAKLQKPREAHPRPSS
jgi:DNA-binding transcriptional LysR family regulator